MDWVWIVFILFSAVFSMIEKIAKKSAAPPIQKSPPSRAPFPPEEYRPVERDGKTIFSDRAELKKEDFEEGGILPATIEESSVERRKLPYKRIRSSLQTSSMLEKENWEIPPSPEDEFMTWEDDNFDIVWAEQGDEEVGYGSEPTGKTVLYDREAIILSLKLAQVLKRPDFKTVPWQRRL